MTEFITGLKSLGPEVLASVIGGLILLLIPWRRAPLGQRGKTRVRIEIDRE